MESAVHEDEEERPRKRICSAEGKENAGAMDVTKAVSVSAELRSKLAAGRGAVRKVPTVVEKAKAKAKGRAGLRRL